MSPYATEMELKPARSGDCGCGCGGGTGADCGCESRCCDLDCLVRPRFFCGQTLTDTDLSAAVDWARSRFALTRYRHGWGVVCGLNVQCHDPGNSRSCCGDAKNGPTIYVTPGYAIDCCGNDLVLCDPLAVSLAKICRPADDPCQSTWNPAIPRAQEPPPPPAPPPAAGLAPGRGSAIDDCLKKLTDNLFSVEVRLKYHEALTQAQRAMFRSGCADTSGCEYTRVREQPCAEVEVVADTEPVDDVEAWVKDFREKMRRIIQELRQAFSINVQTALQYVRTHPPYTLCFIEDLLCCLRPAEPSGAREAKAFTQDWAPLVAMYLFMDWYLHQLECACWSCKPDRGVPIARVLLQRIKTDRGDRCRVVKIDTMEPYRRPLRPELCRPIKRGDVDLAQYVWQPLDSVAARMQLSGIDMGHERIAAADAVDKIASGQLSMPGEMRTVLAHTILDPFARERIVAFSVNNP